MSLRLPLGTVLLSAFAKIKATALFDRNLAYSSPFTNAAYVSSLRSSYQFRHADNHSHATVSYLITFVLFKPVILSSSKDRISWTTLPAQTDPMMHIILPSMGATSAMYVFQKFLIVFEHHTERH